ncbi:DUF1196 domain-containing protein, partial [Vibrio cholerae]
ALTVPLEAFVICVFQHNKHTNPAQP